MDGVAWLNGRILSPAEASVSALDHGYLYGLGCFETLRVYQGRPFRLERHVARLLAGARTLGIQDAPTAAAVVAAVTEAVDAAGLTAARVRFSLTPGPGEPTPDGARHGPPVLLVLVLPHADGPAAGVRLARAAWRVASTSPLAGVKAASYAPYLLARRAARARGADDALLLNERDELVETATGNLFLVRDGVLVTPDLASGPLPGVTREAVLELARAL
ncbi:MAG TPA: aminotransferase class IV, partial [Dehalococcoidia bacterium]